MESVTDQIKIVSSPTTNGGGNNCFQIHDLQTSIDESGLSYYKHELEIEENSCDNNNLAVPPPLKRMSNANSSCSSGTGRSRTSSRNTNGSDELENELIRNELTDTVQLQTTFPQIDPTSIPKVLRRNSSFNDHILDRTERRVLVIYTGGTIGMVKSSRGGLAPLANSLENTVRRFPHLHDESYGDLRFGTRGDRPLVLPEINDEKCRVAYTIFEYDPLLDSTNMTMDDWIRVARDIQSFYEDFDGFVVLHGTDTMSYTASALSFMLEHLGKSVVITGSQIPLFESRSDGRDNFLGALILAGCYVIPEVTVYFGHKLFRGNRITKVSSDSLNAFDSPNFGPLATMGINIQVDYQSIFRPKDISAFQIQTKLSRNVGLLRLFPSITPETVKVFLQAPTQGVVLQTYGSGNFPTNRADLLQAIEEASNRGVLIVNCTQCGHGSVSAIYETGQMTQAAGVIPGWDMTPEAALTKLSYVIGRTDWSLEVKREMLQTNLKGELTKCTRKSYKQHPNSFDHIVDSRDMTFSVENSDLIPRIVKIIANSLGMSLPEEIEEVHKVVGGALTCAFVAQFAGYDYKNLENILGESGSDLSDYSGRTPLHIAAVSGDVHKVEILLKKGASVHKRDIRGYSALRDAIENDRHSVIEVLRRCGAHLTMEKKALGAELNLAACRGDIARLQSFKVAGAHLDQEDPCGRTPLHVAVEAGNEATVEWLLTHGCSPKTMNLYSQTPIDIAKALHRGRILNLLNNFV